MAKENSQKIKLLKLMELLRQETDEQHPMAATVVCQKLNDMEVACDHRTLTRDIQALNDYGYEVMTTMISHEKAYYHICRANISCGLPYIISPTAIYH